MYSKVYFDGREPEVKDYLTVLKTIKLLGLKRSSRVLVYGDGTGKHTHCFRYYQVHGAEGYDPYYEEEPFGLAKGHYHDKVPSTPKGGWDLIFCYDVLEHIPLEDLGKTFRHFRNGKMVLTSICYPEMRKVYADPTHVTVKSRAWWQAMFKKHGFTEEPVPDDFPFKSQIMLWRKA